MAAINYKPSWGDFIDPYDKSKGKYFPLHEHQLKVYNSTARFTAAIAGTGGGKTVLGPIWLIRKITEHFQKTEKPFLGMVVAPTYKVLARATLPCLIETLKGTHLEGKYKESINKYILGGGRGVLWCQGADNPGGLEGGQFDAVWLDEGGQVKYSVWVALQGRTGLKQSPILITTTPYGKNWLYNEFYLRWVEKSKDYAVYQWSSFENPAYTKEEYDRAKSQMTDERGAMRYDGKFMALSGLIYPSFERCIIELTNEEVFELISGDGKLYGGIDFGWNDPFAAIAGYLDENDVLWLFYERYKSKTAIEVHADALPKFTNRTIKWYAEHNPELIRKLRRGGHKVKKAIKNIEAGIEAVNARILTGRLKVIKHLCPATIVESESYIYEETEDDPGGEKPLKNQNDHLMDALRYLIFGIDSKRAA